MQILRHAQYVKHFQYGLGVVVDSNADRTTIDFDLHGIKKFVTHIMMVELMAGEAPAKASPPKRSRKLSAPSAAAQAKANPR